MHVIHFWRINMALESRLSMWKPFKVNMSIKKLQLDFQKAFARSHIKLLKETGLSCQDIKEGKVYSGTNLGRRWQETNFWRLGRCKRDVLHPCVPPLSEFPALAWKQDGGIGLKQHNYVLLSNYFECFVPFLPWFVSTPPNSFPLTQFCVFPDCSQGQETSQELSPTLLLMCPVSPCAGDL